jgi:hypothetical protein
VYISAGYEIVHRNRSVNGIHSEGSMHRTVRTYKTAILWFENIKYFQN